MRTGYEYLSDAYNQKRVARLEFWVGQGYSFEQAKGLAEDDERNEVLAAIADETVRELSPVLRKAGLTLEESMTRMEAVYKAICTVATHRSPPLPQEPGHQETPQARE